MAYTIKAPRDNYNGVQMGIHFNHGEAKIEDAKTAQLFKNIGYEVIEDKPVKAPVKKAIK